MHINSDQLGKELDEIAQQHLSECLQCQLDHKTMLALYKEGQTQSLLTPPDDVWQKIVERQQVSNKVIKLKPRKQFSIYQWSAGVAAAGLLFSMSWLVWNNYQLQNQFQQVMRVNQELELQLVQNNNPTFYQTQLLSKIHQIDLQLMQATSATEKLSLLNKRKEIMAKMNKAKQGGRDEFSI